MTPPDLNTLPKSPRESSTPSLPKPTTPSRRQSHIMNRRPSQHSQSDEGDVPIRHPRPLTTAELHLEMEQEQEAAVNRLARELSALRAQHSASTVSNASSATSAIDTQPQPQPQPQHQTQHIPGQLTPPRHRSSSSLSVRSQANTHAPGSTALASQASVERARDAAGMRSRENSLASGTGIGAGGVTMPVSRSRPPSASPSPGLHGQDPYFQGGAGTRQRRGSSSTSTSRFEEAERARVQLEMARKENEMLAARVRELEGLLRESERGRARDGKVTGKEEIG